MITKTIKTTFKDLINADASLAKLLKSEFEEIEAKPRTKYKYWISKLIPKLSDELQEYNKQRQEIADRNKEIKDDKEVISEKGVKEIMALLETEIEIEARPITIAAEHLPKEITADDLTKLDIYLNIEFDDE